MRNQRTARFLGFLIPLVAALAIAPLSTGVLAYEQKPRPDDPKSLQGVWSRPVMKNLDDEKDQAPLIYYPRRDACKRQLSPLLWIVVDDNLSFVLGGVSRELPRNSDVLVRERHADSIVDVVGHRFTLQTKEKRKLIVLEGRQGPIEIEYLLAGDTLTLHSRHKVYGGTVLGDYDVSGEWRRGWK